MQRRIFLAASALAWCRPDRLGAAENWPSRPLRMIVPGGPGGVIDVRGRWIAQRLATVLGQPVVVENRPGAGGNLGMEAGARSPADGGTVTVVHQGTMTVNPHLYAQPGYDPLTDFVPITRIGMAPLLLALHPSLQARTVEEFVAAAKARPGQLAYGSPGVGTPPHLAVELFRSTAGIEVLHVPYKGGGQAASDLLAGHVQFAMDGLNVLLQHVQAGRVRPLAVTGRRRIASLPQVPTMAEAGWPQYEFQGWVGLAVPSGTPPEIVQLLYQAVHGILSTSEASEWLASFGAEAADDPPAVFAQAIRAEHAKWGRVIRDTGLKLQ